MRQISLLVDDIEQDFRAFHHDHPDVYVALVGLAREWKQAGHRRGAIAQLFEVLRYQTGLGDRQGQFKLNNNHRSRYARLIMANEPDLDGFFGTRVLATDWHEQDAA